MNTKVSHYRIRRFSAFLIGVVFLLAGVFKLLDPVGASLVMEEYFKFFHLGFLNFAAKPIAVALALFESLLGAALISGVLRKPVAYATTAMVGFFTVLTLFLAIFNPPMDCGCFGEVIHLTNFQTFLKNLVLLALALIAYMPFKNFGRTKKRKNYSFCIVSVGIIAFMIYSLVNLPLVDYTAFTLGSELYTPAEDVTEEDANDYISTFIYEKNGQEGVFTLDRLPDSTWTYVRTETVLRNGPEIKESRPQLSFTDSLGDYQDHKALEENVLVVSVYDPSKVKAEEWLRIADALDGASTAGFTSLLLATSSPQAFEGLPAIVPEVRHRLSLSLHFSDRKTLLALNRSNGGATWFSDGQLIKKFSDRDLPSEEQMMELTGKDPIELMLSSSTKGRLGFQGTLLYIFAILFII